MGALQSTPGKVCPRLASSAPPFPRLHASNAKERSHEQFPHCTTRSYIEFTTTDIERTKKFYSTVFGWSFKDWGPDYIDCNAASSGIAIGFAKGAPQQGSQIRADGGALLRGPEGH
jgi:hypothetical protein